MKTSMNSDDAQDAVTAPRRDVLAKKPYSAPKLVVHGTLEQITRNVGNGFVDFPNGSSIAG